MTDFRAKIGALQFELDSKKSQNKELEGLVQLMTNSALAPASETTASKMKQKLQVFMTKLDLAFQENFKLKRELA